MQVSSRRTRPRVDDDPRPVVYQAQPIVLQVILETIADNWCYNDVERKGYARDPHGSAIVRNRWISKADKAICRDVIKEVCILSRDLYKVYAPKRNRMLFRLTSWKLRDFPDSFSTKCLLVIPSNYYYTPQPQEFIYERDQSVTDKDDINYNKRPPIAALAEYIKSARGFLPRQYVPLKPEQSGKINQAPRIMKMAIDVHNVQISYLDLHDVVPLGVTSLTLGRNFMRGIEMGSLPDSLRELSLVNLHKSEKYHVPQGLRRLTLTLDDSFGVPVDWTTSCFVDLPHALEYLCVRNAPVNCRGCAVCDKSDHNHAALPTRSTWIPPGLKAFVLCIERGKTHLPLRFCRIPPTIEHISISLDNGQPAPICLDHCSFSNVQTLFLYGRVCGLDTMIEDSTRLPHLVAVRVEMPEHSLQIPEYGNSDRFASSIEQSLAMAEDADLDKPRISPIRMGYDLALTILAGTSTEMWLDLHNTYIIDLLRPVYQDATQRDMYGDTLFTASAALINATDYFKPTTRSGMDESVLRESLEQAEIKEFGDPEEVKRSFVDSVRQTTGIKLRGIWQRDARNRGRDLFKRIINLVPILEVRPSLIALCAPDPL